MATEGRHLEDAPEPLPIVLVREHEHALRALEHGAEPLDAERLACGVQLINARNVEEGVLPTAQELVR